MDLEEVVNNEIEFEEFICRLKEVEEHKEKCVIYNEWTKVPNPLSSKGCKISRKMPRTAKIPDLCKIIIEELRILKDHLHRAHMQFRAFKHA